ncbi:P-loop NTPase fold protein [Paraburkholderia kururiensis]|uniref:P-loop NTPase fold protein n=1 Tax=Paraburkholderia kururiensis TaxID=984307 RepID=UPI0012E031C3|nr:P-loop NTPase fold protein [Paraburkholderia kururiensis]
MRNDLILTSIKDYIASPSTSYALMINGAWGAGKTFFWRAQVSPAIEAMGKDPVYVSLYGLTKAEDIDSLIVLAMYPILQKKGVKMAWTAIGTGLRKFGIDLSKFDLSTFKGSLKNVILCFDDLERCSAHLDIEDVMGQINRYVEHENIKTLLIANESEIGKDGNERQERYAKIKEKLIGLTFTVEADVDGAVKAAMSNLHPATKKFACNTNLIFPESPRATQPSMSDHLI